MCPGKADHVQLGQVMGGVDEEEQSHTRGVHEVYGQWQVLSLPIQDRVEMGGGGLKFREAWRLEDRNKTAQDITEEILRTSMQEIYPSLKFTTEVGEGEGGWLPTLDIKLRVECTNIISYIFYEKPTTTNTMVQKRTALYENSKNQILANELVRRLANTDVRQVYSECQQS